MSTKILGTVSRIWARSNGDPIVNATVRSVSSFGTAWSIRVVTNSIPLINEELSRGY